MWESHIEPTDLKLLSFLSWRRCQNGELAAPLGFGALQSAKDRWQTSGSAIRPARGSRPSLFDRASLHKIRRGSLRILAET